MPARFRARNRTPASLSRSHEYRLSQEAMRVDAGTLPAGCGWLFPKAETVNVGVGGPLAMTTPARAASWPHEAS
jgi:flavin-dependent dehydrogenase